MSVLLVAGGEVYAPSYSGTRDLLIVHDRLVRLGDVERTSLDALFPEGCDVIDATGCIVTPGLFERRSDH